MISCHQVYLVLITMSSNCSRCGAKLKRSIKFCSVCGTPVAGADTASGSQTTNDVLKCSNCNKILKEGSKFCTKCGAAVEQVPKPPSSPVTNICPNCGYSKNPESSNYCINCGQALSSTAPQPKQTKIEEPITETVSTTMTCSSCGRETKPNSKFCINCGTPLSAITKPEEPSEGLTSAPITTTDPKSTIEPLVVPTKVLASLMARGRQLALEEEYAKNGVESDELFEELSQAAADSDFELEELIDTNINERSELDRLETLHKKGEVSKRVYDRLVKEYEEKLNRMDEKIKEGVVQLYGYKAQIQLDYTRAKEELETINARLLIGDDETEVTEKKNKLSEKATRLKYALIACDHILKKEFNMRNGPLTRFEVTETTIADSKVISNEPEEIEVIESKEESEESESTPSTLPRSLQDTEAGKICPNCGRVTAPEAKFCIYCAAQL